MQVGDLRFWSLRQSDKMSPCCQCTKQAQCIHRCNRSPRSLTATLQNSNLNPNPEPEPQPVAPAFEALGCVASTRLFEPQPPIPPDGSWVKWGFSGPHRNHKGTFKSFLKCHVGKLKGFKLSSPRSGSPPVLMTTRAEARTPQRSCFVQEPKFERC